MSGSPADRSEAVRLLPLRLTADAASRGWKRLEALGADGSTAVLAKALQAVSANLGGMSRLLTVALEDRVDRVGGGLVFERFGLV